MNTNAPSLHHNCLNCNREVTENYCQSCGQKSSTHRYSLKHFVEHDFIHGVWHVDKGVLYTIKQLFTRPGHSVREFIQGKRAKFFSFVTLIVLILAISGLLAPYIHIHISDLMPESSKAAMNTLEKFSTKYPKATILILIPLYSLFSFFWFRKARLNYSEHLVLNSYRTAAELILSLAFSIFTIFYTNITTLLFVYYFIVGLGGMIYAIWFYSQFFGGYGYSKKAALFRAIMVPVSYLFLSGIIGFVMGFAGMAGK
ncbi:DUF3667 domain-containing protein [Pedobacter aquatilis]|uniref:DUF3667 domain-containing protein n=1 Tax=Pedobacter aquatilis TaxID=351343 RepID=UPI0025B2ECAF|nr:DUF3667 domain-containing protein [Pedobacter aquatilis]MDN3586911.1 DUF3667 domain-containing protein [Pedobacter aquatilis]